jgi:hypothetical protein
MKLAILGILSVLAASAQAAPSFEVVSGPSATLAELQSGIDEQAQALKHALNEPVVIAANEAQQNRFAVGKVVVMGAVVQPEWRGRYREMTIRLGLYDQERTTEIGELFVRTFTDPALRTSAQFFAPGSVR